MIHKPDITAADVLAAARLRLGVKWQHQGRTAAALDCIGLVVVVARELGIDHGVDFSAYRRQPDGQTMRAMVARHMTRAPKAPGVLALLAQRSASFPHHLGFLTESLGLIHADARHKRVIETTTLPPDLVIRSAWRFNEMVL